MIIRHNRFVNLVNDLHDIETLDMLREKTIGFGPILACVDDLTIDNNLMTSNKKSRIARLIVWLIAHNTLLLYAVPAFEVFGLGVQIGTWMEQLVVVFQVQVMALQVHQDKDRGHGSGELAKGIVDVLRL